MAESEIKRLHYFTDEFLLEKDFIDEQTYHMDMRRRHNRSCHGVGVVEGLDVVPIDERRVGVTAGMAIDRKGREIVLVDDVVCTFEGTFPRHLTIAYAELHVEADRSTQEGIDNFVRWTERPLLQESPTPPAADSLAITIAIVTKTGANQLVVDTSVAPRAAVSAVGFEAVGEDQLAANAVTNDKLAPGSVGIAALAITQASGDMPGSLAGNAESANPFTLVVDSPSPQFLLASVTPTTLGGAVSFSYTAARDTSSGNNKVIYKLKVKNLTSNPVDFNVNMQTLALA